MKTFADYPDYIDPVQVIDYVQYDSATGEIVQWGTMQRILLESAEEEGKPIIRVKIEDDTAYFVDVKTKKLRKKPARLLKAAAAKKQIKPAAPQKSYAHQFMEAYVAAAEADPTWLKSQPKPLQAFVKMFREARNAGK